MCFLWKQKLNDTVIKDNDYDKSDDKVVNATDFIVTTDLWIF
jgi:hypothetical protein